eukprot:9732421-Lingulodinium_polyedra.AAC.1
MAAASSAAFRRADRAWRSLDRCCTGFAGLIVSTSAPTSASELAQKTKSSRLRAASPSRSRIHSSTLDSQ